MVVQFGFYVAASSVGRALRPTFSHIVSGINPDLHQLRHYQVFRPLDNPSPPANGAAVSRLSKLAALFLVALWLPATLHCALESADVAFLTHDSHEHHHDAPTGGHDDGEEAGHAIEYTAYTASTPSLKVPPPSDSLSALFAALVGSSSVCVEPPLSPARHAPPLELRVAWQFLFRAAPPARAPALNT